jgi:hypothetical protein
LEWGPLAGSYERGNEHSSTIKDGDFIEWLIDYQFIMKKFAPRI